jgi:N-acyl-L-homoserine lactone synthetase
MQQDWSRLTNQLRDHIHRYYPQLLRLSPAADEPWIWELLRMAATASTGVEAAKEQSSAATESISDSTAVG